MGEVVAHRMTPGSQKESESVNLCQIYDNICALDMHWKCESKGSRQQKKSADCKNENEGREFYHQGIDAVAVGALLHVKAFREVQLHLQVVLHRQSVLTVSIHCVRSWPGGAGNVPFTQPRQILRAVHCSPRGSLSWKDQDYTMCLSRFILNSALTY